MNFDVIDMPPCQRAVEIHVEGKRGQKLNLLWQRVDRKTANAWAMRMQAASAQYQDDGGEPVTLTEAAASYIPVDSDGRTVHIPVLHDWVVERGRDEILQDQEDVLRDLFCGSGALLQEWDLKASKDDEEAMPFNDETFDLVFGTSEFFWPVWSDLLEMFNELSTGKDRAKNSKSSGVTGQSRRGKLLA